MKATYKITGTFLLFIMLISVMKNSALYVIYDYDTDLFISMFCENKERPQLKCNGKCKLAKMEKQQNEEDVANTLRQLQTDMIYLYPISSNNVGDNDLSFEQTVKQIAFYSSLYSFLYTSQLVKPPDFVV